jgi:serine-type D-Ala-D-Ala carboxypeptidase (penicillin-binding protein 5/6)
MKNSRISSQQSKVTVHNDINHMSFPQVKRFGNLAASLRIESLRHSFTEGFSMRVFGESLCGRTSPEQISARSRADRHDKLHRSHVVGYGVKVPYIVLFLLFILCCSSVTSVCAAVIKSRAAVVIDAETGKILYAKNPDARLLPASTTKLVNALVVLERAHLDDVTTVSARAAGQPPTKAGLKKGDKVTIRALLYAALMKSANDAAVALAEAVAGSEEAFVKLMNSKAMAIGASDTRFVNANGLPASGQHITARDLAIIMREAIKYPLLREIMGTRVTEVSTKSGKTMFIKNTNRLLWSDDEVLGGKTGYTRQARHCFVCAGERENDTIIVAILGAPNRGLLWKESEYLMDVGEKVMSNASEPVVYLTKLRESPGRTLVGRKRHGRKAAIRRRSRKNRAVLVKQKTREEKIRAIARQEDDGNRG